MTKFFRAMALSAAFIALVALGHGTARADEVTVAGSTLGAFNGGVLGNSATLLGLTYNNSTFTGTTAGGFVGIGAAPGTPNVNNLGSFTLNSTDNVYNGNTFQLRVTFTQPSGIQGSNQANYSGTLTGTVTSTPTGGVLIQFNPAPVAFTFINGSTTGSFSLSLNNLSITAPGTVALTGTVLGSQRTSAVPEPASMLLLGTGLAGLAGAARRRFKKDVE